MHCKTRSAGRTQNSVSPTPIVSEELRKLYDSLGLDAQLQPQAAATACIDSLGACAQLCRTMSTLTTAHTSPRE